MDEEINCTYLVFPAQCDGKLQRAATGEKRRHYSQCFQSKICKLHIYIYIAIKM